MNVEPVRLRSRVPKWVTPRLHPFWRFWYDHIRPKYSFVRIVLMISLGLSLFCIWPYLSVLPVPAPVVLVDRAPSAPHVIRSSFVPDGLSLTLSVPPMAATRSTVKIAYDLTATSPPSAVISGTITMSSINQAAGVGLPANQPIGPITAVRNLQEHGEYEVELSDIFDGDKLELEVILELSDGERSETYRNMYLEFPVVHWPNWMILLIFLVMPALALASEVIWKAFVKLMGVYQDRGAKSA